MKIPSPLRIRGLAQSAGAGGSLIAAAVCCLIAFSALLAFRAWSGSVQPTSDGRLALRAPYAKAAGRAISGPVAASTAPPAVRRATPRRPTVRRRDHSAPPAPRRAAGVRRVRVLRPPASLDAPVAGTAPSGRAPTAGAPPAPVPEAGATSGTGGDGGATTTRGPVESVARTATDTLEHVTDPLGLPPAVRRPVEQAQQAAGNLARTVDGVTAPVPPALP